MLERERDDKETRLNLEQNTSARIRRENQQLKMQKSDTENQLRDITNKYKIR